MGWHTSEISAPFEPVYTHWLEEHLLGILL